MSESKLRDKLIKAAGKVRAHLNKAGLATVDKPSLKERRAEADKAPPPKLKNGVYR